MGKKTKSEKNHIRTNLDILMNLPALIIERNPKIKALYKNNVIPEESNEEFNRIIRETYGVFPGFPFPVLDLIDAEKKPSELLLRIDLNYSKDEIMYVLEKFVTSKIKEYRENHKLKIERKYPQKWVKYLEIWDLKNGDPPWVQTGDTKMPFGTKKKDSRSWTYEEIAKYIYPDMQAPDQLKSAINKVKKQYGAAYKLICGEKYKPKEIKKRIDELDVGYCFNCPDQHCKETSEICPKVFEELERIEVKRSHKLISKQQHSDLEQFTKSQKKPTAEKQF